MPPRSAAKTKARSTPAASPPFAWREFPWTWLLGAIWFNAVTLSAGTYYAQLHWQAYALWVGLGAIAIAVGGGWLVFRDGELQRFGHGVDGWLVLAFAGMSLISLNATDTARSWLAVSQCLLYAWIGYSALQPFARYPERAARFLGVGLAAMLATCYLVHGFFQSFWEIAVVPMPHNLVWPIGHWNFLGSFICLLWPLAAVLGLQANRRREAWFWGLVTLLSAWTVFRCGSRSSLVAMGLQAGAYAWLARKHWQSELQRLSRTTWWTVGALAAVVALIKADFVMSLGRRLVNLATAFWQMVSGQQVAEISSAQRWDMWRGGVQGLLDQPWLGHGLGSVPTQFLHYQPSNPRWGDVAIPQLHNTLVNLAFEGGVLLTALVLLGGLLVVRLLRRASRQPDARLRQVAQALAVGLFGYAVCLQADFHWQVPSLTLTLVMVVTLVGVLAGPVRLSHSAWRIGAGFLALPLFFAGTRLWLPAVQAHYHYDRGRQLLAARQPEAALAAWTSAVDDDPTTLFYRLARGNLLQAEALLQRPARQDLLAQARADFKAINDRAALASSLLKEGTIALQLGDAAGALIPLERAVRYIPYSGASHYLLGMAQVHTGQTEAAAASLARAIVCAPVLTESSFLSDPIAQPVRQPALQEAAGILRRWLSLAPANAELHYRLGRLLLASGDLKAARQALETARREAEKTGPPPDGEAQVLANLPTRIKIALSRLDLDEGQADKVVARYQSALTKGSIDAPSLVLAAWAHDALGKKDLARQLAAKAIEPIRGLAPKITVDELMNREKARKALVTISLDRRDVWIIQSFRKLAPPIFHTSLTFSGEALFTPDEVFPWAELPIADPFARAKGPGGA